MTPETAVPAPLPVAPATGSPPVPRPRLRARLRTSLLARGEPMSWLTGSALVIALAMILGLLVLIVVRGMATFWPAPVVQARTADGKVYLGDVVEKQTFRPDKDALGAMRPEAREAVEQAGGQATRHELHTENYELSNTHFQWVNDYDVVEETQPQWAVVLERFEKGRFYGFPRAFLEDGREVATEPAEVWARFNQYHDAVLARGREHFRLQKHDLGPLEERKKALADALERARKEYGETAPEYLRAQQKLADYEPEYNRERTRIQERINELDRENARYQIRMGTADGKEEVLAVADVVRGYAPNQLDFGGKLGVYLSRWGEFLSEGPRGDGTEGGVLPAIWGTVVMTLLMSVAVVPFGVLAALYLREYARAGPITSLVRIAVNNLAGVPSIVFGMFGLVFFCYIIGGTVDQVFFKADLPNPTFGKGALIWAALTLALLTLPVVIVATEEALAAVPQSLREGSYACGASKWQTIRRIVLPRALPGIMTGMILAVARGAGEVAPIMLVGAVPAAEELPIDTTAPFVHPQRSFMHLGFQIYDLGFQSQNSQAAKPMVFTITLLLIALIAVLNVTAVWLRGRLRRRYLTSAF